MALRLVSYDVASRTAVLAAGAHARGRVKVSNVTREQAEALVVKLARHWREENDVRGQPAGVYLMRGN